MACLLDDQGIELTWRRARGRAGTTDWQQIWMTIFRPGCRPGRQMRQNIG
jgi:hypothetical protein